MTLMTMTEKLSSLERSSSTKQIKTLTPIEGASEVSERKPRPMWEGMLDGKAGDRFFSKIDITEPGDCWNWNAGTVNGRGQFGFQVNRKSIPYRAPRLAYFYWVGEIPDGLFVCHRCDNPACVNPNHLFLGTQQDNIDDMWRKERGTRGTEVAMSVLTEDQVRSIRSQYVYKSREFGARALADKFGVCPESIRKIVVGKTWGWLK